MFPLILLAIETSTEFCSAALLQGTQVLARHEHAGQTHSQRILPMVGELLDEAGIRLAGCQAIVYGAGPGSFTGLRIACSVVQGLAWGAALPVIPVGTLAALAEALRASLQDPAHLPAGCRVLCALDARMAEVYWAVYDWDGQDWHERVAPSLSQPALLGPLLSRLPGDAPLWACGNAMQIFASDLVPLVTRVGAPQLPEARFMLPLAVRAAAQGRLQPAHEAAPLYVRNQVALTTDERDLARRQKELGLARAQQLVPALVEPATPL